MLLNNFNCTVFVLLSNLRRGIFKDKSRIVNDVEEALEFLKQAAIESNNEKNIHNSSLKDKELEIRAEIYFLCVSLKLSNFFEAALANAQS